MKTINWILTFIVAAIIVAAFFVIRGSFTSTKVKIGSDELVIKKTAYDSLLILANRPVVFKLDTVFIKGKTVTVTKRVPTEKVIDSITYYSDTIKRSDIDAKVEFAMLGELLDLRWEYTPIVKEIREVKTEYVTKFVDKKVDVPKNGLYVYGIAGGNEKSFIYGGGIDFINKRDKTLGYQYQRFGKDNFHSIKIGLKIKF